MARNKRPSFLKRQKEQQRRARAEEKRATRRARRQGEATVPTDPEAPDATVEQTGEREGTEA